MKIRNGFVSNSSSASFVLKTNKLSSNQLCRIFELIKEDECDGTILKLDYDRWSITISENEISGYTWMDNEELSELFSELNIPYTEYEIESD